LAEGHRQTACRETFDPFDVLYPFPFQSSSNEITETSDHRAGHATLTSSTSLILSERQKLLRLIKRFQKTASTSSATDKETKRAEQDLKRARVMLNYILHFP
jgi:hypothetical protein